MRGMQLSLCSWCCDGPVLHVGIHQRLGVVWGHCLVVAWPSQPWAGQVVLSGFSVCVSSYHARTTHDSQPAASRAERESFQVCCVC